MSRSLHVVQVVCSDGFAGVERHVSSLARALGERGHQVTVLGGHHLRMPAVLSDSPRVSWHAADSIAAAVHKLSHTRGDVVHAHMTEAEFAAVLSRPRHRGRVVTTRHFARPRGTSRVARAAGRLIGHAIAAEIAVSDYVAASIDAASTVIPAGIIAPRDVVDPTTRRNAVLMVSRLESEKRVDIALDVWRRSGLAERGWTLEIAGDGACREQLQQLALALGIAESCHFLGVRDDVPALLDTAGVMLATCPVEAFGLAVVEAMSHGVAVVAVAGGAHSEILGRAPNPLLFAGADPCAGAEMLRRLADDPAARRDRGAELRAVQQAEFVVSRQAEQVERLYLDVLA